MYWIDLRSDTVTQPTMAMRQAMKDAIVGDDVYGDDPTVNQLETMAARRMGKEAALFVVSGTMGNQLAVMTHTTPGQEIIANRNCHIIHYECGSPARLSGVGYALTDREDGTVTAEDVISLKRPEHDAHFPATGLVCVENALCNGTVVLYPWMYSAVPAGQPMTIISRSTWTAPGFLTRPWPLGLTPLKLLPARTPSCSVSQRACAPLSAHCCAGQKIS